MSPRDRKSYGHICFSGDWEFFEIHGEVYKAPRSAPLADVSGPKPRRHGRWESSRAHFNRNRQHIAPDCHERRLVTDVGDDLVTATASRYPKAGRHVDGLFVRQHVPNMDSIDGYFGSSETLPGIRVVPMADFGGPRSVFYATNDFERSERLAEAIRHSGEINPLIVGVDRDGPFIIEGAHRFVALYYLKARVFPAVVEVDLEQTNELREASRRRPCRPDAGSWEYREWYDQSSDELAGYVDEVQGLGGLSHTNNQRNLLPKMFEWRFCELHVSELMHTWRFRSAAEWRRWYESERRARRDEDGDDNYFDALEQEWNQVPSSIGPIVAIYLNGKLDIGDGWHRAAIAVTRGWETVPTIVGRLDA